MPPGAVIDSAEIPFTEGRVGVQERPHGLTYAFPTANGRGWERFGIPGYVTPGYPTNGKEIPVGPVTIQTVAPPASFKDAEAHQLIASLQKMVKALEATVKSQAATIQQLQARPAAATSPAQLTDALWSVLTSGKGEDWLYALLARNTGGVVGQVQRLAAETVRAMKGRGEI